MSVVDRMRGALRGWKSGESLQAAEAGSRKTSSLPAVLSPWRPGGNVHAMPKPTPQNLRRFAETPVARRAINVVKNRISSMDWQVRAKRDAVADDALNEKLSILRSVLEQPNPQDSFRTLIEAVLEDVIVGGFGAVEVEATGDVVMPLRLWPVDGATVAMAGQWDGNADAPRYLQTPFGPASSVPLLDRELMYVRMNPRTHTPFGLGRLEVAFETVSQFLSANRYAGRLASNSVVQYALWLDEATPQQHERLIRWWQDEVEGTGQVPILSSANKPEVLRFAGGTDADLRLQWQEFLLRILASAFDLPPMLLGIQSDVNRSTAAEMAALSGLQVTSATAAALQIDTGTDAPPGAGFEVRRSDANFGSSNVTDLVLNSPVRSFSIPRLAFRERFFVRMYDGALTRQYSPVSSVVLTNLPTS